MDKFDVDSEPAKPVPILFVYDLASVPIVKPSGPHTVPVLLSAVNWSVITMVNLNIESLGVVIILVDVNDLLLVLRVEDHVSLLPEFLVLLLLCDDNFLLLGLLKSDII